VKCSVPAGREVPEPAGMTVCPGAAKAWTAVRSAAGRRQRERVAECGMISSVSVFAARVENPLRAEG